MTIKLKPRIVISRANYDKVMWWVNHAEGEVSGMGTVTYDERAHTFTIDEVLLLQQKCSAATTELEAGAVAQAEYAMRDHEGAGMRWWWHSHVNMNVFWSGTDEATIQELGEAGWFLATVFNKREETRSCLYQGKPFQMFSDQIDFEIDEGEAGGECDCYATTITGIEFPYFCPFCGAYLQDPTLEQGWLTEFEDKVSPYTYTNRWGYGSGGTQFTRTLVDDYDEGWSRWFSNSTPPRQSSTPMTKVTADLTEYHKLEATYARMDDSDPLCAKALQNIEKLEDKLYEYVAEGLLTYGDIYRYGTSD